ncbi:MAG: CesT family type III secretion system chaperone [Polaromonas sp.]|nr:CesT family type III secretion system chaperone [Polaromonas sp.]
MNTVSNNASQAHPAILAFMTRRGIAAKDLRSDGRLTLNFDQKYRVHMHTASHKRVALTTQLLSLGGRYHDSVTDEVLERLVGLSAGMLQEHASSLCLDERAKSLLLQQTLPADASAETVEAALADFVNVLPFWTSTCANEARLMFA